MRLGELPQQRGPQPPHPLGEPRPLWVQRTRKWYGVLNAD